MRAWKEYPFCCMCFFSRLYVFRLFPFISFLLSILMHYYIITRRVRLHDSLFLRTQSSCIFVSSLWRNLIFLQIYAHMHSLCAFSMFIMHAHALYILALTFIFFCCCCNICKLCAFLYMFITLWYVCLTSYAIYTQTCARPKRRASNWWARRHAQGEPHWRL